jgi:hypothetical protein
MKKKVSNTKFIFVILYIVVVDAISKLIEKIDNPKKPSL